MDGHFVPNLTMGPVIVKACRQVTKLPLDVHLMIESPENLLEAFAQAGSSLISVHVQTCPTCTGHYKRFMNWDESGHRAYPLLTPCRFCGN